jgi:hypothetical protein
VPGGLFEERQVVDNLWDGVDSNGVINVGSARFDIMIEGERPQGMPFGAAPCYADINGDGVPELVVGDARGFIWVFPVRSPRGVFPPLFDRGQFLQAFFGRALVIDVADYNGDGQNDILVGTAEGVVQIVQNRGKGVFIPPDATPSYAALDVAAVRRRQPLDTAGMFPLIMQGRTALCIGSFAAPRLYDWDRNGKPDLIIGEGSYSANAIYVFPNAGSVAAPRFPAAQRRWLAYGLGREQLVPAIGDLDGDGKVDLLVGDRTGTLWWYRQIATNRAADPFELTQPVSTPLLVGDTHTPVGVLPRPYLADLDGDGDLDLLLGCNDGVVRVSRNIGTRTKPAFAAAVPLRARDVLKPYLRPPWPWEIAGRGDDNAAVMLTALDDTDDRGERIRGAHVSFVEGYTSRGGVLFNHSGLRLKYDTRYTLTFRARGRNISVRCHIGQAGEQYVRGDVLETQFGGGGEYPLSLSPNWQRFNCAFTLPHLTESRRTNIYTGANFNFSLSDAKPDAFFDLADVRIVIGSVDDAAAQ